MVAADGMSSPLRRAAGIGVERREYPPAWSLDVNGAEVADEVSAYRTARGLCLVYPLPGGRCRLYAQVTPGEFRGRVDLEAWCGRLLADVPAIRPLGQALRASLHRRQLLAVYRLRSAHWAYRGSRSPGGRPRGAPDGAQASTAPSVTPRRSPPAWPPRAAHRNRPPWTGRCGPSRRPGGPGWTTSPPSATTPPA
ncbi:hypothetical protein V2I01_33840 [Micromonospora sp. BRA006-A]|nr:hypothetical protein [Micromonospora sp. BRA006-A]